MHSEIQSIMAQPLAMQKQLLKRRDETKAAQEEVKAVKTQAAIEIEEIKRQAAGRLALNKFGPERFGTNNDSIKFFTSFPSYEHIQLSFQFVQPSAEMMTHCYASGVRESKPARRNMLLVNELFIFLVRLKLGLFEQDLACRLMIHRSSVCRKLITWSNFMYFLLGCHMIWPSRDDVNRHMPEGFKKLYPSTRLILTCTQIFVQTPTSLLLQSQHYSTYRSNTTLKRLIGITPNGAIFM